MLRFERWREDIPPETISTPVELLDSIPRGVTLENFWDFVRHHNAAECHKMIQVNGETMVVVAKTSGGIADVFFGWYQYEPHRFVTVKMPQVGWADDASTQERFRIERVLLDQQSVDKSRLYWPWLLDEGYIEHPSKSSLQTTAAVIEIVPGILLKDLIAQYPFVTKNPAFVAAVGMQIKHAHAVMHEQNVVNRDIKPRNIIIVNSTPFVRLFDANTAYVHQSCATDPGFTVGTPEYMAPEVIRGQMPMPKSDDYSLGCLLYEMVNGKPPFNQGSGMEIMLKQINVEPKPLDTPLWPVIAQLLAKRPDKRYQDDLELLRVLQEHALGDPKLVERVGLAFTEL